ncbi:aspartate/tyrosine/aromatic aminotransferase [Lacticaseibacillus paracasei subsp. paracasei Lpp126]|uniref:Aspartate/tyrosine/aromatic aminotransferase n=1 Tax=Lacticaseibacillus paracasei subsp. paracasei Lpp126 TaxID=1256206 RepID=S2S2V1_LACPA|nr:aspartate/tyrosine/aromatic aminotransferase [Lacticaseibacillus paracasei subsp. paracasei Lpp126]
MRISYAASMADLKLAAERIAKYMATH